MVKLSCSLVAPKYVSLPFQVPQTSQSPPVFNGGLSEKLPEASVATIRDIIEFVAVWFSVGSSNV